MLPNGSATSQEYANGGKVRKGNYTYIPNEEIESLTTWNGVEFKGDELLDGSYAKGRRKYAKGGVMADGGVYPMGSGKVGRTNALLFFLDKNDKIDVEVGEFDGVGDIFQYAKWYEKEKGFKFLPSLTLRGKGIEKRSPYFSDYFDELTLEKAEKLRGEFLQDVDIIPVWIDDTEYSEYAKGGKVGDAYSNVFKEVVNIDSTAMYIRKWAVVQDDEGSNIELLAVATITNFEGYMPEDELPAEGNFGIDITLVPAKKFISKKHIESANDENSSISDNTIANIVNYMGGLNYAPEDKEVFKTFEDAEKYLFSKELNDKITADAVMAGFILDKNYNRTGQTNWERLYYMTGKSERFAKGGKVGRKNYTYIPNEEIESLTTWNGVEFKGDELLDGSYAKGRRKYGEGGMIDDEAVLRAYVACALWSTSDMDSEDDEMLDANYSISDISEGTLAKMKADIRKFISENKDAIKESGMEDEQLGHDLWLSRNGHGAGFFDRGYDSDVEEKLMNAAIEMKGVDLYAGDDGEIYC